VKTIRRDGRYLRVASPDWHEPLDGGHAAVKGGRWNPPGSFAVVYLNRSERVARLNVDRLYSGLPYGPEDLDPLDAPLLVATSVPDNSYLDIITAAGLAAVGLPATYPDDEAGDRIGHGVCQTIGEDAWTAGLNGVACRSAAPGAAAGDEELAFYERGHRLVENERRAFDDWYWAA
jgi:RES domain-containing protein